MRHNRTLPAVSAQGLVCGVKVGETTLSASVFGEDSTLSLSRDSVVVKVVLATGLHIRFPSRFLVAGTVVEAYAALRHGEEDILGGMDPYSASKASADLAAQSYIKNYLLLYYEYDVFDYIDHSQSYE